MHWVLPLCLIFCATTFAAESEPDVLSVTAERPATKFNSEQMHFQIENNPDKQKRKAIFVITANFLAIPQDYVRLGHYECDDLRKMERHRLTLINWQQGLGAEAKEHADIDRHKRDDVLAFVGGYRLDPHSPLRSDALTFLEGAWDIANWRAIDAVEVRKKAGAKRVVLRYRGKTNFRETKTSDELKCKKESTKAIACYIPNYGTAYLPN